LKAWQWIIVIRLITMDLWGIVGNNVDFYDILSTLSGSHVRVPLSLTMVKVGIESMLSREANDVVVEQNGVLDP
jgi:hypothetical protein